MSNQNNTRGFGLIEVLVSLLVLVIGILGMAGLHSRSLQHNQIAYIHSQGTILVTDMLDRLRINQTQALTTNNYVVEKNDAAVIDCISEFYPNKCELGSCTPEQLAQYDIDQWLFQLSCYLPYAKGEITFEKYGDHRIYIITLSFDEYKERFKPADLILRSVI